MIFFPFQKEEACQGKSGATCVGTEAKVHANRWRKVDFNL